MTSLRPGEINLDLIPNDWALTPIGSNKAPYLSAWQNHPQTKDEIKKHLESGKAKAVGLISGQQYNNPDHLVWVDVDGLSVWETIKEMSGNTDVSISLPPTLTICSGRPGRERLLYRVPKDKTKYLQRSKYATQPIVPNEKLEILCTNKRQGVLMGLHPQTDGYYTKEKLDYRFASKLPELPQWILAYIRSQNLKFRGKAEESHHRMYSPDFAIDLKTGGYEATLYQINKACELIANNNGFDDYETWIKIGMAIHSFDETLVDVWDQYSQSSDKYDEQVILDKWKSFSPGQLTVGTLFHEAKQFGFKYDPAAASAFPSSDELLEQQASDFFNFQQSDPMSQLLSNAILSAQDFERDSGFEAENRRQKKNAPDNQIVSAIVSHFNGNLVFSKSHNGFLHYKEGVWKQLDIDDAQCLVQNFMNEIASTLLPQGYTNERVVAVTKSLSRELVDINEWNPDPDLRCFKNFVVNLRTLETMPHSKAYRLTRKIPYDYDPNAECPQIKEWLSYTQYGDQEVVEVLRAWLRACLTNAYDCQRFLEIVGPGKTGKTTFTQLCVALVGMDNAVACDFENLNSRFELARLTDASLATFNDVSRYAGDVSNFKKMTGGDNLRAEYKNSAAKIPGFIFKGMVIVSANEVIATNDATSGLKRRRLSVKFSRRFTGSAAEQCELIGNKLVNGEPITTGRFAYEMPGLINWLLQMPDDHMRNLVIDTARYSKVLKELSDRVDLSTNIQYKWLAERVVFDPFTSVPIKFGYARRNKESGSLTEYKDVYRKLYPSYCEFVLQHSANSSKSGAMNQARFKDWVESELLEVLQLNTPFYNDRGIGVDHLSLRFGIQNNEEMERNKYKGYPNVYEVAEDPAYWMKFFERLTEHTSLTLKRNFRIKLD